MADMVPKKKLDDLARIAGVSVSTVSRALSGNPAVNAETRQRIRALADSQGYDAPMRRGRRLTAADVADGPRITVVMAPALQAMPAPFDPFALSLIGGIGAAMRERGLELSITPKLPADIAGLTQLIEEDKADGFIFFGQSAIHEALNHLARQKRGMVVWGAQTQDQHYCSVGSDNFRGAEKATSHLLRLGRRRIAHIGCDLGLELQQRRQGYTQALQDSDIALDDSLLRDCSLDANSAMEAVDDMLDSGTKIDAIVASSDLAAIGALRALTRRGLCCPDDIAVIGYDDIEIAAYTSPTLTTIRQDTVKAGRLLVSKVLRMIEGHRAASERLPTELIVRESCGA